MSRLDKHKAAHKAAMSRKKVQSNPLEEIMRPPEAEVAPHGRCQTCGTPLSHINDWFGGKGELYSRYGCMNCPPPVAAPSPVGASRPVCGRCKGVGMVYYGDDNEKPCPECSAPPLPPKRPQNSPAVRDERMRRKGRFPTATELHAKYHADLGGAGMWLVEATVWTDQTGPSDGNAGKTFSQSGPGIHGCIESLWDQYCRWRDEQKEAAK